MKKYYFQDTDLTKKILLNFKNKNNIVREFGNRKISKKILRTLI